MPNAPATPTMSFRIPPDLRRELERLADDRGETMTQIAIRALWREVRRTQN